MKLIKSIFLLITIGLVSSQTISEEVISEEVTQSVETETTAPKDEVLPKFNLPSGFYVESTIQLEIIKPDPEAILYYTLDGSLPTENSTVYEGPLTLKNKSEEENVYSAIEGVSPNYDYIPTEKVRKANIIRTVAKLPDGTLTHVVSGTYFVGINRQKIYKDVPVVSLITDPENLFDYEKGIYVLGKAYDEWRNTPGNENKQPYQAVGNFSNKGQDYERPVTMDFIPANNNTVAFTQDLGMRIKGKSTRTYNQKSLRLISREEYGKKNIKYPLIPGNMRADGTGPLKKYKSFNLRSGGNDFLYTKIRDSVLQDLITNNLFETQQSTPAVVFIDGEYWGVYHIIEEYSDNYIENNYGIPKEDVLIVKAFKNLEDGIKKHFDNYKKEMKFLREKDMTIPENYTRATEIMDIEGLSWFSAIQTYIECKDGFLYGDNVAMWRSTVQNDTLPKADGKVRIMTYDLEYSTGLYNNEKSVYDFNVFPLLFNRTSTVGNKNGSQVLVSLLKNDTFRESYLRDLCDTQNIIFDSKIVNKKIDEASAALALLMTENYARYGLPYEASESEAQLTPEEFYKTEVQQFKTWMNKRKTVFLDFVAEAFNLQPALKISVTSNDFKKGGFTINNVYDFNGKVFNEKFEGKYFRENIVYITGKPAQGRKLKSWSVTKCKVVSNNKYTLGIRPTKGCKVSLKFK